MHISTFLTPSDGNGDAPHILTVPGLNNSGPAHWQSLWENSLPNCSRVDLGNWEKPDAESWPDRLNAAIEQVKAPLFLVAHSLGCHAIARWAQQQKPGFGNPVAAALLVAPPELDHASIDPRLLPFAPAARGILPFPSILVASRNDPYIDFGRARRLAFFWGSDFADAGNSGHINAASALGSWDFGLYLLRRLIRRTRTDAALAQGNAFLPPAAPSPLALSI